MALSVTQDPSKDYFSDDTYYEFTSYWVAAHNPIVFKVSNTKFPANTDDNNLDVITISSVGGGAVELTLSADHKLIKNSYVKLSGFSDESYNGYFSVISTPYPDSIVVQVPYDENVTFGSATVQKAYRNYHQRVKVFAGLPSAHKWSGLKPETEIGVLRSDPNSQNEAVFDVQDYVKQKINIDNNLSLISLPNDVNLWTGFKIEYAESFTDFSGVTGNLFPITDYNDNGGYAELTLSGSGFSFEVGDWVQLSDFLETSYNTEWQIIAVIDNNKIVINRLYDPYFILYGSEQAQDFDTSLDTSVSSFETYDVQFYASNSSIPFGNSLGNNLAEYMNIRGNNDLAPFPSSFGRFVVFDGKYYDITGYIDKIFTDNLGANEVPALEIKEYDESGALIATQHYEMTNEQEGVWRMPFVGIEIRVELISMNFRSEDLTQLYFELSNAWINMSLLSVFSNLNTANLTYKYNTTSDFTTPIYSSSSLASFNNFMDGVSSGFVAISTSDTGFIDGGLLVELQTEGTAISNTSIDIDIALRDITNDIVFYAESFEITSITSSDVGDSFLYGFRDDTPANDDWTDFPLSLAALNAELKNNSIGAAHIYVGNNIAAAKTITINGNFVDNRGKGYIAIDDQQQSPDYRSALDGNGAYFDGNTAFITSTWNPLERTDPFTYVGVIGLKTGTARYIWSQGFWGSTFPPTVADSAIVIGVFSGQVRVFMISTSPTSQYIDVSSSSVNPYVKATAKSILIVTYDGSSNASGFNFYVDGVKLGRTITKDNLASNIVGVNTELYLGRRLNNTTARFFGDQRIMQLLDQDYSNNPEVIREIVNNGSAEGVVADARFLLDVDYNQVGAAVPTVRAGTPAYTFAVNSGTAQYRDFYTNG